MEKKSYFRRTESKNINNTYIMDKKIEMNPNLLVRFLGKPAAEFTC